MASYQRVALYVFFDAIERDLVDRIRSLPFSDDTAILTADEATKAISRLEKREGSVVDIQDQMALLPGLDLGDKYAALMRHKNMLDQASRNYYAGLAQQFFDVLPVRNATMHGRPLTTIEFAQGFQLANEFLKAGVYWPNLSQTFRQYTLDPHIYIGKAVAFLEDDIPGAVLNNLPVPDYEDTGFLPRPVLEKELRQKIFGRHPVITVLGEGGNGKTALVLQTLYGLVASNDHSYDAIVWVSAKTARLTSKEVERIEGAITDSLGVFEDIARFEPGNDQPIERVRRLLAENKVLLVIDNLETVLDETLRSFAADIPGESKLVFTSRVPLGSDLSVIVGDFDAKDARTYLRRLIDAYDIPLLSRKNNDQLDAFTEKLSRKPLLLKWFALGAASGLTPESIIAQPDIALKFCMENVIDRLSGDSKLITTALSIVSGPVSAAILQHILDLPGPQTESGIAELIRFGLLQRDDRNRGEISYQLKSFARSYISRIVRPEPQISQDILKRYRAVESVYQSERGSKAFDRYDPRAFLVRSRSEALVAQKLKRVLMLSYRGDISGAEDLLQDARMLSPGYFEVFRTEAILAIKNGEITRAQDAYEAAVELSHDQPQLYAAYAGFLSRFLSDYEGAGKKLSEALALDPDAHYLLQEAARNAFFAYDFPLADKLITRAKHSVIRTYRNEIIFADLTTQLYYREAEYLAKSGDYNGVSRALKSLLNAIRETDRNLFDEKHLDHLGKVYRLVSELRRVPQFMDEELLAEVVHAVQELENELDPARGLPFTSDFQSHGLDLCIGALKPEGRTDTFGFLKDQHGIDTYLNRYMVEGFVWDALCSGRRASYSIAPGQNGRTAAVVLKLLP